jgi:signal peptidase I
MAGITPTTLNELWEKLLAKHGACWGKIASNSMHPLMRAGDRVFIENISREKVRFGDMVVFNRGGQLIIHRVLGRRVIDRQRYILEKGDATLRSSLVPASSIIGRVSLITRSKGTSGVLSGRGRVAQLMLAAVSYTSIYLWAVLGHGLARRWQRHYSGFFWLLRLLIIQAIPGQRQPEPKGW